MRAVQSRKEKSASGFGRKDDYSRVRTALYERWPGMTAETISSSFARVRAFAIICYRRRRCCRALRVMRM